MGDLNVTPSGAAARKVTVAQYVFQNPDSEGVGLILPFTKGDPTPTPVLHFPVGPGNVTVALDGAWASTAPVAVVLSGIDETGQAASETITIPANTGPGSMIDGVTGWIRVLSVDSVSAPAGWTAGTLELQTPSPRKFALPRPAGATGLTVLSETSWTSTTPGTTSAQTVGTLDGHDLYTPGVAIPDPNTASFAVDYAFLS